MHHPALGSFSVRVWQRSSSADDDEEICNNVHIRGFVCFVFFVFFTHCPECVMIINRNSKCTRSVGFFYNSLIHHSFPPLIWSAVRCAHMLHSWKASWSTVSVWASRLSTSLIAFAFLCTFVFYRAVFMTLILCLFTPFSLRMVPSVVFTPLTKAQLLTYGDFSLFWVLILWKMSSL